jgi:hypothetical protein
MSVDIPTKTPWENQLNQVYTLEVPDLSLFTSAAAAAAESFI